MMKILFCSPNPLTQTLGAPKVWVELAEELRCRGWQCDLLGPADIASGLPHPSDPAFRGAYSQALRDYLREHAPHYDIVDYDHTHLPYPRADFCASALFVARSVLLAQHMETIHIPAPAGWRSRVSGLVKGRTRRAYVRRILDIADRTVRAADLVNVSNGADKALLQKQGIAAEKIVALPYGISRARRPLFDAVGSAPPPHKTVAFVGTFDYRKGAREFPALVCGILQRQPDANFKLLGTKGMFATREAVLSHFPAQVRDRIEVVPQYDPASLPEHLADCAAGVFPSYFEGFPFGVLEMLAASLPVIAYDAPGAPMMLPAEYLVPCGDARTMGAKVAALLGNPAQLAAARAWARQCAQRFSWQQAALDTMTVYQAHWEKRQEQKREETRR